MTLVEAYFALGPLTGVPDDERRARAAGVMQETIRRLARRGCATDDWEDVAAEVLYRLFVRGPRSDDPSQPSTDEAIEAYLMRSVRNAMIDRARKSGRLVSMSSDPDSGPGREPAGREAGPLDGLVSQELEADYHAAEREFFETIVPQLASRIRQPSYRPDFIEMAALLRHGAGEDLSAAELMASIGEDPRDRKSVNRFHQRMHRARERMVRWLQNDLPERDMPDERRRSFRLVVGRLRAR